MKKRLIALILCMCFLLGGCDRIFGSKKYYEEVIIGDYTYYQVNNYMKESKYSYFDFEVKWLEDISSIDSNDTYRYVSINYTLNNIIDTYSDEYLSLSHGKVLDYEQYKELCEKYSMNQDYNNSHKNYLVVMNANPEYDIEFHPVSVIYDKEEDVIQYFYAEEINYSSKEKHSFICVIPTDCDVDTEVDMKYCRTEDELEDLKEWYKEYPGGIIEYKPVIYLYPEEDNTPVNVSFELTDAELTCTYPLYDDGWSVIANKNGLLTINDKEYNYLYWEGTNHRGYSIEEGFCVKGSDTATFLEEILAELGLNRREANEFIVYWLPLMEVNEYNVISFDIKQYEEMYKLNVNPVPDTEIRVFMTWYGTDEEITIAPQIINTPTREGFTVVEWGGSKIK